MKKYLVLDIGGSAIKYAFMTKEGTFFSKNKVKTPLHSLEHLIQQIYELYLLDSSVAGIAISMPGVIDVKNGIAITGGALLYIDHTPLVQLLEQKCQVPVTIANDAKCAGLCEVGFGVLQDVQDAIVLVLGTAIGGCLIINHEVYQGHRFCAGEVSSLQTNANEFFSGKQSFWKKNGSRGLLKCVQEATQSNAFMSGEEIFEKAKQGDQKVLAGLDAFCKDLVVQIFNLQTILDPQRIAIGGGISIQPLLFERIHYFFDLVYDELYDGPIHKPDIVACKYLNDANLLGALHQFLILKTSI